MESAPITVAVANDYPLVIEGVAALLRRDPRLRVVELAAQTKPSQPVDIVLFDSFATRRGPEGMIARLAEDRRFTRVVAYSWNTAAEQVHKALEQGADGYVAKGVGAKALADALVRVHAGEKVVEPRKLADLPEMEEWPGKRAGLTPREAEIIALVTQGVTNDEIASICYLSINSVKSYIRSAYRKMGVSRRSQAVLWGIEHGMRPTTQRRDA